MKKQPESYHFSPPWAKQQSPPLMCCNSFLTDPPPHNSPVGPLNTGEIRSLLSTNLCLAAKAKIHTQLPTARCHLLPVLSQWSLFSPLQPHQPLLFPEHTKNNPQPQWPPWRTLLPGLLSLDMQPAQGQDVHETYRQTRGLSLPNLVCFYGQLWAQVEPTPH